MDVVAHACAVGRGVVGAVDARGSTVEQRLEHEREQVVRARVEHLGRAGSDDVEVAQARVRETGGARLVGEQPLADELRLAVRRFGMLRGRLGDEVDVGRAVHGGARREHDAVDALRLHGGEQHRRAGHVLLVGVQRALHRDAGVLEAREVHDALHVELLERVLEHAAVEDRAVHEPLLLGDELRACPTRGRRRRRCRCPSPGMRARRATRCSPLPR